MGFGGIEGCVDASENDVGAALASHLSNLVPAKGIGGVDANSDDISGMNVGWFDGLKSFVNQNGIPKAGGGCSGQNIEPSRSNDRGAERNIAGINQMNSHAGLPPKADRKQTGLLVTADGSMLPDSMPESKTPP
jgi:hypothetical protein